MANTKVARTPIQAPISRATSKAFPKAASRDRPPVGGAVVTAPMIQMTREVRAAAAAVKKVTCAMPVLTRESAIFVDALES